MSESTPNEGKKEFYRKKNFNRNRKKDYSQGQNSQYANKKPFHNNRIIKSIETIDDVKQDIIDIEKEIMLEVREIQRIRFS